MTLKSERTKLINEVRMIDDIVFIKKIRAEIEENVRAEAAAKGIDLDEYNRDIDQAMAEIDAGYFTTHEEVKKMLLKKWKRSHK